MTWKGRKDLQKSWVLTLIGGKKYVGWDFAETFINEASDIYLAVGENPNRFEVRKLSNVVRVLENPSIGCLQIPL